MRHHPETSAHSLCTLLPSPILQTCASPCSVEELKEGCLAPFAMLSCSLSEFGRQLSQTSRRLRGEPLIKAIVHAPFLQARTRASPKQRFVPCKRPSQLAGTWVRYRKHSARCGGRCRQMRSSPTSPRWSMRWPSVNG